MTVSGSSSQSGAYPSLSRREARQQSFGSSDPPLWTPVSQTSDPPVEASSKFITSSTVPPLVRTPAGSPPFVTRESSLLMPTPPTGTFDQQTGTEAQGGHFRRVSDPPSSVFGRLPPLLEVPVDFNIPAPLSARDCEWSFVSAGRILILILT